MVCTVSLYQSTCSSHLWSWHNLTVSFLRSRSREGLTDMTLRLKADHVLWLDASDDIFMSTNPLQSCEDRLPGCCWYSIVYRVLEHFCPPPATIVGVRSFNVSKNVFWNIQLDAKLVPVYCFQLADQIFQLWIAWRIWEEVTWHKKYSLSGESMLWTNISIYLPLVAMEINSRPSVYKKQW